MGISSWEEGLGWLEEECEAGGGEEGGEGFCGSVWVLGEDLGGDGDAFGDGSDGGDGSFEDSAAGSDSGSGSGSFSFWFWRFELGLGFTISSSLSSDFVCWRSGSCFSSSSRLFSIS